MSNTDKTKPWRIRVAEHHPWAEHDHRNGVCDLPDDPRDTRNWLSGVACYWSDANLVYGGGSCCSGCGCRMCSAYFERRAARRKSRHLAQRATRGYVTGGEW